MKYLLYLFLFLPYAVSASGPLQAEPPLYDGSSPIPGGYTHASFNGGDGPDFRRWIAENITYPEKCRLECIEGVVLASFIVGRRGEITDIEIVRSPDPLLSRVVFAAIDSSRPMWGPGLDADGCPVRIKYTVPVNFKLTPCETEGEQAAADEVTYDGLIRLPDGYTHALFEGGDLVNFREWVSRNVRYPAEFCIEGRVVCRFVVDKGGCTESIEILVSPDEMLSSEVRRLVESSSGMWTPGTDSAGDGIRIKYVVGVRIR